MYTNRRAQFDYFLIEKIEAGMVLTGTEIKSLRQGGLDFRDAYAKFERDELFLDNLYIPPYDKGSYNNHDPRRKRKLLLHKHELKELKIAISHKGLTVIPTRIYFKNGKAKLELATAKGKKNYDKRQTERAREDKREMERFR